jgi:hypothetical protein
MIIPHRLRGLLIDVGLRLAPLPLAVPELQRRNLIARSDALISEALRDCDTGDIRPVGR